MSPLLSAALKAETFISAQFMVVAVRVAWTVDMHAIARAHARFKPTGLGSNSSLECRLLVKTEHRTALHWDSEGFVAGGDWLLEREGHRAALALGQ
jgi:hypothetical protein